ncbi:MAG: hypothetical protein M1838_000992 [Thelocarpon superellum]|nr:MAG: hypothetical protein M1838_000992 [Thelocarpon superellum]
MDSPPVQFRPLSSFSPKQRLNCLQAIKLIERKTFPTNEALDLDNELKKRNTVLLLAQGEQSVQADVVAYLIYARNRRLALLHKLCVVESFRRRGLAKLMLHHLHQTLLDQGCTQVQLWVDEARAPAKCLYDACGFEVVQCVENYYGPGRTGLKMILALERPT